MRADFGARKDSRDLSDWATDLLPSLLPTPVSFSKANSSLDLLLCTLGGSNVILGRACGKEALGVTWCQRLGRCTLPLCPRRLLDLPGPLLSPTFPPVSHIPTILPPSQLCPPPTGDQPFIHNRLLVYTGWLSCNSCQAAHQWLKSRHSLN